MAEQVPAQRTPLAPSQAQQLIASALEAELGREPTAAEQKMLLAQSALETDRWRAMWNWNFGNSIASASAPFFLLPKHTHHFRPFSSAWQGVAYFVALIRRRFPEAWALLGSGDTLAFAAALKAKNYYEGSAEKYGALMRSLYAEFSAGRSSSSSEAVARSQMRSPDPSANGRNDGDRGVSGLVLLFLGWEWYRRSRWLR